MQYDAVAPLGKLVRPMIRAERPVILYMRCTPLPRRIRSCSEVMVWAVCLTIADDDSVSAGAGSSYVPVTLGVYCRSSRENSHCVAATSADMVMVETGEEDVSVVWGIMHRRSRSYIYTTWGLAAEAEQTTGAALAPPATCRLAPWDRRAPS